MKHLWLIAVLSLAACSKESKGESDKSDKAEKSEGCEYVSQKDVEKIADHKLKSVKGEACSWESTSEDEPRSVHVNVDKYTDDAWDGCKGKSADDLGDKAKGVGSELCVKKGKKLIRIGTVVTGDNDKDQAAAQKLAKKVLAKLD